MAPSSPAPTRASSRKRLACAKPEEAELDQQEATKRPRKAPAEKPKPAKASGRKKKNSKDPEDAERPAEDDVCAEEPDEEEMAMGEEDAEEQQQQEREAAARKRVAQPNRVRHTADGDREPEFCGDPFPAHEARVKWPHRYQRSAPRRPDEEDDVKACCHYRSAMVDDTVYSLNNDVYVKAWENEPDYIGRITEFFEGTDRRCYFTGHWFFCAVDTVISTMMSENVDDHKHNLKRVFLSEEKNDNVLDCLISKVKIVHIDPNMDPEAKAQLVADCELYYDMSYTVAYSTFANIPSENGASGSDAASGISSDDVASEAPYGTPVRKAALDLYSGCGGMSTGLCLGAALAGLKLETRWAVDLNSFACESLKYNHPDTEVLIQLVHQRMKRKMMSLLERMSLW